MICPVAAPGEAVIWANRRGGDLPTLELGRSRPPDTL
jgi:hypothetical protein